MPITKDAGAQSSSIKRVDFTFADLGAVSPTDNEAMGLPSDAIIIQGAIVITTPFNSTTNTLTVGDKTAANRYKSAVDAKTAAYTPLVPTGVVTNTANLCTLVINSAFTGVAPTAGAGYLYVEYLQKSRADFTQR